VVFPRSCWTEALDFKCCSRNTCRNVEYYDYVGQLDVVKRGLVWYYFPIHSLLKKNIEINITRFKKKNKKKKK